MDESDLKAAGFEDVKQRNPVYPGGCHRDGGHPTGREPVGETMQVTGKRAKFLDRLGIAICGHTDPVFLSSHIDACGMRVDDGHIFGRGFVLLTFFGHMFLQSGEEWGEHLRKETIVGGVLRAARLFHLDRTKAERWRNANTALEATGHSIRFVAGEGLYRVARASAWALAVPRSTKIPRGA